MTFAEEGKLIGAMVHYVGKILAMEQDAGMTVSFLRKKSVCINDTFLLPYHWGCDGGGEEMLQGSIGPLEGRHPAVVSPYQDFSPLNRYEVK